jgi:predicted DsbA family dithiol-disulfide isomerase
MTLPFTVPSDTVVVFSDLLCPFAHVALHRFRRARAAAGLDDIVRVDHHVFPLELFNGPHSRPGTDSEAVVAAKTQALALSEALDAALRHAFWTDNLPIGHRDTILTIAAGVTGLDVDALRATLDTGSARGAVMHDFTVASTEAVSTSPHVFLPDGSNEPNPGITVAWIGPWASGFPTVTSDDPDAWTQIVERVHPW